MSIYAPFCAPEHQSAQAMDQHRRHRLAFGAMRLARTLGEQMAWYRETDEECIRAAADQLIAMGAPL